MDWNTFHAASERPEINFELRTPLKRGRSVSPRRNWSLNNVSLLLVRELGRTTASVTRLMKTENEEV